MKTTSRFLFGTLFLPVLLLIGGPAPLSAEILYQLAKPAGSQVVPYWIASSRRCAQRGQANCPRGELDFFAVDGRQALTPVPQNAFLKSLDFSLPICFVVHGDLTSFADVRRAAPRIVTWLRNGAPNQPVQFVFFTWPSDDENNPVPQLAVSARGERAEFNACYLARLISQFPAQTRISFFGHSFGARVTSATLHLLGGGAIPGCTYRCRQPVIRNYRAAFIAAAIDRSWLNPGNRYGMALGMTDSLLNFRNGADVVLNLYPLRSVMSQQALGRVGFSPGDRRQMGPLSARVFERDATYLIGGRHAWVHYYSRPQIAATMAPLLVYQNRAVKAPLVKTPPTVVPTSQPRSVLPESTGLKKFPSRVGF